MSSGICTLIVCTGITHIAGFKDLQECDYRTKVLATAWAHAKCKGRLAKLKDEYDVDEVCKIAGLHVKAFVTSFKWQMDASQTSLLGWVKPNTNIIIIIIIIN